jgi:lipocalin
MPISYLPVNRFFCTAARYSRDGDEKVKVYNYENIDKVNGEASSTNICGTVKNASEPAELIVAPCFLPIALGGPYWIVHYDAEKGLGLISGGQPTHEGANGCRTGTGENGSGLWIALRTSERNESLIKEGRAILSKLGYDITVLQDIKHEGCAYTPKGIEEW